MSNASATEYAQQIAQQIADRTEAGYPFGVRHTESGDSYSDMTEALEQKDGATEDEFEAATAWDYLADVLDIQYLVSSDKEYRSGRVCIALGGPTAWINTETRQIEAAWWSGTVFASIPAEFCDELDSTLEDYFNC